MNKNQNQAVVIANLKGVVNALAELVSNWDNDTQALFEKYHDGYNWGIPSLDDTQGEFQAFVEWLESVA